MIEEIVKDLSTIVIKDSFLNDIHDFECYDVNGVPILTSLVRGGLSEGGKERVFYDNELNEIRRTAYSRDFDCLLFPYKNKNVLISAEYNCESEHIPLGERCYKIHPINKRLEMYDQNLKSVNTIHLDDNQDPYLIKNLIFNNCNYLYAHGFSESYLLDENSNVRIYVTNGWENPFMRGKLSYIKLNNDKDFIFTFSAYNGERLYYRNLTINQDSENYVTGEFAIFDSDFKRNVI